MEGEQLLIKLALKGDQRAFGKLINAYKNYVFAIILNMVRDQQEAENLSQETFISMYRGLPTLKGENFKGWLGRIAANKAIDWNRKKYREQQLLKGGLQPLDETIPQDGPSPEEQLLQVEDQTRLKELLHQLPPKYGEVLELYFIWGRSYQQIAQQEGISIRTVETRLYRGKRLLRDAWKEEGLYDPFE